MARLSIEDRSIFQLLVPCPMHGMMITVPECEACPYHGGITKERHHFPDDSYVTGYVDCRYIGPDDEEGRGRPDEDRLSTCPHCQPTRALFGTYEDEEP
jgi:hypothetical protein